jgi:hypothetical protein
MPLPRMATRRWMIAVAAVALLLGVFVTWRRAAYLMRLALAHETIARYLRSTAGPRETKRPQNTMKDLRGCTNGRRRAPGSSSHQTLRRSRAPVAQVLRQPAAVLGQAEVLRQSRRSRKREDLRHEEEPVEGRRVIIKASRRGN